jgi:hypothetical protein
VIGNYSRGIYSSQLHPTLKTEPIQAFIKQLKPNILLSVHPILTPITPPPQQIGNYTLDGLNSMYEKYKRPTHILL